MDDYENIHCVNPLYLMIGKAIGHIGVKNGSKYLFFDLLDENKEVLKNTQNFGMGLKIKLKPKMMLSANTLKISWKSNLIQIMIYR